MVDLSAKARAVLVVVFPVILSACASSSSEISASYVSPTQYSSFNCDQLALELARLNARKSELAGNLDKAASNDEGLTAVSILLFWPAAFALGGNEAQEAEYARLKGEYDAVQQMGVEKNCRLDPQKAGVSPLVKNYGTAAPGNESVYEYYGEAEDELNSGNVDKNLWSRALVEAEGDETKRKAKYIELRAIELYNEDSGSTPILPQGGLPGTQTAYIAEPEFDLSGIYTARVSRKGSSDYWCFNQKRTFQIELRQDNNAIKGRFLSGPTGEIEGTVIKDKLKFSYYTTKCNGSLEGEWEIGPDGKGMQGHGWSDIEWVLKRQF